MTNRRLGMGLITTVVGLTIGCGEDRPPIVGPPPPVALTVRSVTPSTGGSATSTTIQIAGTGFVSGATLTLDGSGTTVTFISATQLRAIAPPHDAGPIDIVVTNPNGDSGRLSGGFSYIERPVRLTLTGDTSLEASGETSQLTATATFADGRTVDVTRESVWGSSFPAVATVSADGQLTAAGLGSTLIFLRYPLTNSYLFQQTEVAVTPRGTFALTGRVREPGAGGVPGATVVHVASGQSTVSDNSGYFSFGGLTGSRRFSATKENYESNEGDLTPEDFFDIPMQRVVRLDADAHQPAYSSRLAPNDMDYLIDGTHCQPCRLIRITSTTGRPAQLTLTWTTSVDLHLWIDGRRRDPSGLQREIAADIPTGSGEVVIYIGKVRPASVEDYVSFTLNAVPAGGQ